MNGNLNLLSHDVPVDAGPQLLRSPEPPASPTPPPPPTPPPEANLLVLTYELFRPTVLRPELKDVARVELSMADGLLLYIPAREGAKKLYFYIDDNFQMNFLSHAKMTLRLQKVSYRIYLFDLGGYTLYRVSQKNTTLLILNISNML